MRRSTQSLEHSNGARIKPKQYFRFVDARTPCNQRTTRKFTVPLESTQDQQKKLSWTIALPSFSPRHRSLTSMREAEPLLGPQVPPAPAAAPLPALSHSRLLRAFEAIMEPAATVLSLWLLVWFVEGALTPRWLVALGPGVRTGVPGPPAIACIGGPRGCEHRAGLGVDVRPPVRARLRDRRTGRVLSRRGAQLALVRAARPAGRACCIALGARRTSFGCRARRCVQWSSA